MNTVSLVNTESSLCRRCHQDRKIAAYGLCVSCSVGFYTRRKKLSGNLTPEQYLARFPYGKRRFANAPLVKALTPAAPTILPQELIPGFVYASTDMYRIAEIIRRLAQKEISVLILGETGVGKELVARALHELGPRQKKPFRTIDCTTLGVEIATDELFSHVQGAFTGATRNRKGLFAEADGGTAFLDELSALPLETQAKLLRVLEQREFRQVGASEYQSIDVRIIGASNEPLDDLVHQGRFRQDLFHRLNVFPLRIPPLRERRDEIPMLVRHFPGKESGDSPDITHEALQRLVGHGWPGNVRELRNVLDRALCLRDDERAPITLDELPKEIFDVPFSRSA